MSNLQQEQTTARDEASTIQTETESGKNIKAAGTHKQIPTLVVMKSSKTAKTNVKPSTVKRVEDPDSNSKSACVSTVSTNQHSLPTKNKSKQQSNQEIPGNTLHGPKNIPGRQPRSADTKTKHSKEKRKRSNSSNPQPTQDESFLLKKMTHSSKDNFNSKDISASMELLENNVNNSTMQQAAENESVVEGDLLKENYLASHGNNLYTGPKDDLQKDSHDILNCTEGAFQEPQGFDISEHPNTNKPKAIEKHRHSIPGVGKGSTESYSTERCSSFALARRGSRPATINKEPAPRARRSLSFSRENSAPDRDNSTPRRDNSTPGRVRVLIDRANSAPSPESPTKRPEENSSSADSLRNLNLELRDQVTKMRHQLEAQRGNIKHAHWQKVLDLRQLRQQEHERLTLALAEQKEKLDKEKAKELDHIRDQLTAKGELDLQKLTRHKDAEITKLKMEVSCKDVMVQRLLGENRHAQLKLNIDVRRSKLLDDLKELRREKKELEDTLSSADVAERTFCNDLRRHTQSFELELAKVKRETQLEIKQLIEQLKNKDKLISQLEKDLGHKWVAAHLAALEREYSEGARGSTMSAPSHPLGVLPDDSYDPFSWTPTSTPTTGGVEEERSNIAEGFTQGKQDLPKKLKDYKERNKELVEKCREHLHRNKELIAQNRAYKDSSEKVLQENRKMQELLEHSKLHVLQLSRKLGEAQAEKTSLEQQTKSTEELRKEIMEDKKTISALRQACANKDRRIELMQHHKKKRRLVGSAEKSMGVKETFFGYEEDTKSVDSDNSFSSHSHSTISDDDVWDEVLSMEETERNYQRLMMEQLQLQKSYAQLHGKCPTSQDPQREAMAKMTLQNDLFNAQCRVEKLEKLINEVGEGEVIKILKERETIIANNKEYIEKAQFWEKEGRRVQHELNKALERCEDLEFQLMEMEQEHDDKQSSTCEVSTQNSLSEYHEQLERLAEIDHQQHVAVKQMEQLRNDLVILLKGKGREGDAVLKTLDKITEEERRRAQSLESIAGELQMKVISLQKEKDGLYDQINFMGQNPGKGNHSAAVSFARERQENLELKSEVAQLSCSESKLLAERIHLLEQLEDWKNQYESLKQQLDILTRTQNQQKESPPLKSDSPESMTRSSSSPSLSPTLLTRRPSKDRKSKPRSGDDPMETKRRRSSRDIHIFDDNHSDLNSSKSLGEVKSDSSLLSSPKNIKRSEDVQSVKESVADIEAMKRSLRVKDVQLQNLNEENFNLQDQLRQCTLEKSAEAEADQQLLLDRLEVLEAEAGLLRKENEALAQRLKQRMEEYQEELNPRVTELEDYCEDLQERLHASEMTERQLRDKVRLVEQSIDESENTEMAVREKYEELLAREAESKKQIQELQRTGRELRDIVLDKDIVEQALRDKVDFLQKAEAAASKRIDELEAIEKELREQLELKSDSKTSCQREVHKIQELKHQITFLETDNKALSARVAELEENEEILRENWRRVADEDFNRTQCLEEKVKMLESVNRDLKSKLADAQEYFVINTLPSENSLAAELAQSHSRAPRRAATFDDDDYFNDDGDSVDGNDSDSTEASQADTDKKNLKDKLKQLERQLSDVAEEKNTKIESLQEKIVSLKENEIKLSETIAELEMIERELRAKLALYESSEITVEKMLKYQSRIEELRTSQESLLDQIESMENQGMTLQEKMQEMERTLRGKIVTLEVEMKGFKQKELKDAARIRELEKQEKELSEKVAKQAEKENGLYVKISSLMDENKKSKEELNAVKSSTLEKEDKVRKANLMEVRYMEKEMESGKRISSLSTKLRHKEEELRQKEAALQEEVATLQKELANRNAEESQKYAALEKSFAQKEKDLQATIASLGEDLKALINERDECFRQMQELLDRNTDLNDKDGEYCKELDILRSEVASIKISEQEYEERIRHLQESLQAEKKKSEEAEIKLTSLEKELAREKEKVLTIENKIINVKSEIGEKMKNIELSFVEKESEYEKQKLSLQEELRLKDEKVRELEKELSEKLLYISELEAQCDELKSKAAFNDSETMEKIADFGKMLVEKNESIQELQNCLVGKETSYKEQLHFWETECTSLKEEISEKNKMIEELEQKCELKGNELSSLTTNQTTVENDLRNNLAFLNSQLLHETASREKDQSSLEQAVVREKVLSSEIDALKTEMEQLKLQLLEKISELEDKNNENCKLAVELKNIKDMSKEADYKLQVRKDEQDKTTEKLRQELDVAMNKLQQLELEMSQKDSMIENIHVDKENFQKEKQAQIELLMEEKQILFEEHVQKSEVLVQKSERESQNKEAELVRLKKELDEKNVLLEKQISERNEMDAYMQSLHLQIQTLKEDVENLSQKLVLKTSEAVDYQQEIQKLKEEKDEKSSQVELLEKQIAEQHHEIEQRSYEQKDSQTLMSSKQQELEQAKTELQKCLQEIDKYKSTVHFKENEFIEQNQMCRQMSESLEELNVQYKKQNSEYKQLEYKVTNAELRLVDAENRYRELEAKCASLEMQLKESFAQTQHAEQVIRMKEEECQQLEVKLTSFSKDFEATSLQIQETEKIFIIKQKEFKHLESELEKVIKERDELKAVVAEREKMHEETFGKFSSLQKQHEQLKSESSALHGQFITQHVESESEVKTLKQKLSHVEETLEETQNQLKTSEDININLKDQLHKTEQTLKLTEQNCNTLKEKLSSAEKQLSETNQSITELSCKISTLENSLQEKESFCRDSQDDFGSLKQKYSDVESECTNLRSQLNYSQQMAENAQILCNKNEEKLQEVSLALEETRTKLTSLENKFSESDASCKSLLSQLENSQRCLNSSQEEAKVYKEQVTSLGENLKNLKQVVEENKDLVLKHERFHQEQTDIETLYKNHVLELESAKEQANCLQEELIQTVASYENVSANLVQCEQKLTSTLTELESLHKNMDSIVVQNEAKCSQLESLCQTLQEEVNSKLHTIEVLKSSEAELTLSVSHLQQDNTSLKATLDTVSGKMQTDESFLSELIETNQNISGKLYQLEAKLRDSDNKIQLLEQNLIKITSEKDEFVSQIKHLKDKNKQLEADNTALQEELNNAAVQLKNIRNDSDKSQATFESQLSELSKSKEETDKALKETQFELVEKSNCIVKMETKIENLKTICSEINYLKSQVSELEKDKTDLLQQLTEQGSRSEKTEIVDESEIFVSLSAGLHAEPTSQVNYNDSTELRNTFSSYEDHCGENGMNIEKLMGEIDNYKRTDTENQEKLHNLEKLLKEMREKEVKMSERMCQLEGREKELLEQISDIETTVIVPLETENQELKDEVNVVKQERDDAQSRINKWGDDEEDHQDIEMVHKSLEDALITRDELEKKVEILSVDISKLEQDKENLMKKIVDLETNESEYKDKIEALEDEVERLHGLEKTTSLVEETEACLIDRVLDLEEKEQQLLAELAELKNKTLSPAGDQIDGQVSYESLSERLKYLEQKNAVLQDAEGRYMDKIMELEEIQNKLQSEILRLRASSSAFTDSASVEAATVTKDSSLRLMHNASTDSSSALSVNNSPTNSMSVPKDTADLTLTSEQTMNTSDVPSYINELEAQIKNLTAICTDQTVKLKYLEEKCELLHDSEAKLMEKLLENESAENRKPSACDNESDLQQKLETLMEENEFLAENVENYKQLYKEEKEVTNDLHDRLLENSSVIQDLQDTKEELKATQKMVEEIQSEYEEQLSEREELEAKLGNLLAQSQQRVSDLQIQLIALQKHEEELQRLNAVVQDGGNPQDIAKIIEREKTEALRKLEAELKSDFHQHEQELQRQIQILQQQMQELQADQKQLEAGHKAQLEDVQHSRLELQQHVNNLKASELSLRSQVTCLMQREHDLLNHVDRLEKQLEEMKDKAEVTCEVPEEESFQSDSGMSADDQRTRYYNSEKSSSEQSLPLESPVTSQVFSSSLTLNLTHPSRFAAKRTSASYSDVETPSPELVPTAHRGRARQSSIDSVSQEELVFLVEELQNKELALKKRLHQLEAFADSDLSQRVEELELENQTLQRKLRYAESQINTSLTRTTTQESSNVFFPQENTFSNIGALNESSEHTREADASSSVLSSSSADDMLDRPEDVLHKRIKELENQDKHNKDQLSDLERDREVLHEIARKDKATIHDLSVRIRELELSEHTLKDQVNSLEASESSLFSKCEDLEASKAKLEDRVHELAVHERRLRELVRRLKLDEEHWLSKSGGMESAVAELSANEQHLKRLLQDVAMEKSGLSERADYLEARIQELETVEATLLQRLKSSENMEMNLKNKMIQLENSERAAHSKVSELDVMNLDLSQRLQKTLEDNVVLSQRISQLQGQINELDLRLLSSQDSELAYKQHMESLQKNESSLQKKVREYELREIDSQAKIREFEQMNDILKDKVATLQRSENRLRLRLQELEGLVGQGTGELTATQRQKVPQKLEDCQKHVIYLQNTVENLQLQLREALRSSQTRLASKTDDTKKVSMPVDDYRQLQTKSALLGETMYQMEEVERVNRELSETILQLRQGKGASGHEVEIEVLKRRLASYKTFISKLKSSLSVGQATSLWDPELDSGLQGDTLPARQIHGLESERVLQSVRGLQDGKAETSNQRGAQQLGLTGNKDTIVQSKATLILSTQSADVNSDSDSSGSKPKTTGGEESHWRAIEARKPVLVASSWGGAIATVGTGAKQAPPTDQNGSKQSSTPEVEEVIVSLHLQSESELSSHHRTNQNDTDCSSSPVPPPRRMRAHRANKNMNNKNNIQSSGNESSDGTLTESDTPANTASATNKKHFGNQKSLPSSANRYTSQEHSQKRAPLTGFGEDSFYLPSSTQEGVDSLDDGEAPPLPCSGPPGAEKHTSSPSSNNESVERKNSLDSLDNSSSGMSIRDRIAMIERQFQVERHKDRADSDQVLHRNKKAADGIKQADVLDKDNKHLRDELPPAYRRKEKINRLEKELEDKRRYINILELWLSNFEELLKNPNKQTDRQLMEQLHQELIRLRSELQHVGYSRDDAVLDPAALKTELERKNREIVFKRNEIDSLTSQLKDCQDECRSIEGMRQTTLDCLRALEHELIDLQNTDQHLLEAKRKIQDLRTQYESKCVDMNNERTKSSQLELTLRNTILERDCVKLDLEKVEAERNKLKQVVEELTRKIEDLSRAEVRKSFLEEQLNSLNNLFISRADKTKEVYEENLILRDHLQQSEAELLRLRNLCDDFNNLSARYDEMENQKQQAVNMVRPLQAKLEHLARKCQEKDALLRRLGAELRRSTYRPSSALDDLGRLETVMNQEDYNTDILPVNRPVPLRPEKYRGHSPSSSVEELELTYPFSDTDSAPATISKRKRPKPYISNRPRSADTFGSGPGIQRGAHAHSRSFLEVRRLKEQPGFAGLEASQSHFVAIADYDPVLFSQSGRPGLELGLREGQMVLVTGPMDRTGYFEAEVNGRIGLVPANYLQPIHKISSCRSDPWLFPSYNQRSEQPEKFQHLYPEPSTAVRGGQNVRREEKHVQTSNAGKSKRMQGLLPDPPSNLHVKNIINESSILLSWSPPRLDNRGSNSGVKLLGFMVYLDNQEYMRILNPKICEMIMENLDLEHPHHLAVQSLYTEGHVSARTELVFEGILRIVQEKASPQRAAGKEDLDTDLSSVLSNAHYKRGHRKTMVALYDYNPEKQSPHDYTSFELAFPAGQLMYVYGQPRPDGFFHGEIEGKRGLVPACFVEDISERTQKRIMNEGAHISQTQH